MTDQIVGAPADQHAPVQGHAPWWRRRSVFIVAGAVVVLAAAGATAWALSGPGAFSTSGSMAVTSPGFLGDSSAPGLPKQGDACHSTGGFTDIQAGAQVVVTDPSSKTVAVGSLGAGKVGIDSLTCEFPFTIANVPAGQPFYKVEVTHRGGIQYTEKQMRAGIALSLG